VLGTPGGENIGEGHKCLFQGELLQPLLATLIFAVVLVLLIAQIFNKELASTEKPLKQVCTP